MSKNYISVKKKFLYALIGATLWLFISVVLSKSWLQELSKITGPMLAFFIIFGLAYIPGWISSFLMLSLIMDKQPKFKDLNPSVPITVLIAAYNEELSIQETLKYVEKQDYQGPMKVIVINNNSNDNTAGKVHEFSKTTSLDCMCIDQEIPGKFNALNKGLEIVNTEYTITLDADTLMHPCAVRYLVSRFVSSNSNVKAVAGAVMVRNSRDNMLARVQEWDYFLAIASIKRMQGLFQGTLVAQGAFSIYNTEALREVGGWSDAIGEDIVLTWDLLRRGYQVYFEPLAVAFTDVPTKFSHFYKQRSRWARGMIEGLRKVKPWQQPSIYTKLLTFINVLLPFMDIAYTLFWIPGFLLALSGRFYIVGPMSLSVLPITLLSFLYLNWYQSNKVFKPLNLKVRKNTTGFIGFVLGYQIIMSPISVIGYIQEFFGLKRVWK